MLRSQRRGWPWQKRRRRPWSQLRVSMHGDFDIRRSQSYGVVASILARRMEAGWLDGNMQVVDQSTPLCPIVRIRKLGIFRLSIPGATCIGLGWMGGLWMDGCPAIALTSTAWTEDGLRAGLAMMRGQTENEDETFEAGLSLELLLSIAYGWPGTWPPRGFGWAGCWLKVPDYWAWLRALLLHACKPMKNLTKTLIVWNDISSPREAEARLDLINYRDSTGRRMVSSASGGPSMAGLVRFVGEGKDGAKSEHHPHC